MRLNLKKREHEPLHSSCGARNDSWLLGLRLRASHRPPPRGDGRSDWRLLKAYYYKVLRLLCESYSLTQCCRFTGIIPVFAVFLIRKQRYWEVVFESGIDLFDFPRHTQL